MLKKLLPFFCFTPLLTSQNDELEFRHRLNIKNREQESTIDNCDIDSYTKLIAQTATFTYDAIIQDDPVEFGRQFAEFNEGILDAAISKSKCSDNVFGLEDYQHAAMLNTLQESCPINNNHQPYLFFNWVVGLKAKDKTQYKNKQTKYLMTTITSLMPQDKSPCLISQRNCLFFRNFIDSSVLFCRASQNEQMVEVKAIEGNQQITQGMMH